MSLQSEGRIIVAGDMGKQGGTYDFALAVYHSAGSPVAVEEEERPSQYALSQNYPNPFNPETRIRFTLPEAGHVVVKVFNVLGQEVATLAGGHYAAGSYDLRWQARDLSGAPLPSGTYLYRIEAAAFAQTKIMTLVR